MLGEEALAGASLKVKDVLEMICKYAEIEREALGWTLYTLSKASRGSIAFTAGSLSITLEKWLDHSTIKLELQKGSVKHTITYEIDFKLAASLLEKEETQRQESRSQKHTEPEEQKQKGGQAKQSSSEH